MTHVAIRCGLLFALALAVPVTCAAADGDAARPDVAWMEALLAEARAEMPAAEAPATPLAAPCSPDCDALNGTACTLAGARTTCYVPIPGGCQAYTCRCSSGLHWACP